MGNGKQYTILSKQLMHLRNNPRHVGGILGLIATIYLLIQLNQPKNGFSDEELNNFTFDVPSPLSKIADDNKEPKDPRVYELAKSESSNFFTDIPTNKWKMLKRLAQSVQPNTRGDPMKTPSTPGTWFQMHYEPEFSCQFEARIGLKGDGGKWVCDPHRISREKGECLIYSVGSNGEASFEASLLKDISKECEIHIFDFGDYKETVAKQVGHNPNVHYHQWGISDKTHGMFKTLDDTVKQLGHTDRTIDIFKIDCEGCELDTFQAWLDAPVKLRQILIEVHPKLSVLRPKVRLPETVNMFKALHDAGYVITHKEPNIQYSLSGHCVEYNLLLLSPEFWKSE
jgi:hypothetical protein